MTDTPFVRTAFGDEEAWQALRTAVSTLNEDGFVAYVHVVDDPALRDFSPEQVTELLGGHSLVVIADEAAQTAPEHPLLVLHREDGEWDRVRVIAGELWSIENNISLANMDWEDFTGAVDDDGVFRGF
jgi:hypothetical protein